MEGNACLYEVTFSFYNPNSVSVWVTITAPGNEGFFVSSTVELIPGQSYPVVIFHPLNGFSGGTVNIDIDGHYNNRDCYTKFAIKFPGLCEGLRISPETPKADGVSDTNVLVVAPNPASTSTTIYYAYANNANQKTIEVRDMQGRLLWQASPSNAIGNFVLDTARYAEGHYIIIMKDNGKVIKHSRLIIK